MNKLIILGNLGRDAEVREVGEQKVIAFTVAITEKYTDRTGNVVENTVWVSCSKWVSSTGSTNIAQYLKKGTKVAVTGKASVRAYTTGSGEAAASLELRVEDLHLAGAAPTAGNTATTPPANRPAPVANIHTPSNTPASTNEVVDDLPF